jgi:hypothetical protein
MPAVCETAGGVAEGGLACCVLADVRVAGFRAAGLGVATRGASTVTAGKAVWAFVFDGVRESALPSTSRLALPKARWGYIKIFLTTGSLAGLNDCTNRHGCSRADHFGCS